LHPASLHFLIVSSIASTNGPCTFRFRESCVLDDGNFCDTLLEKIDKEDKSKNKNNSVSSSGSLASDLMKSDLDLLKKLQTETL
jgi:hypothetical protein